MCMPHRDGACIRTDDEASSFFIRSESFISCALAGAKSPVTDTTDNSQCLFTKSSLTTDVTQQHSLCLKLIMSPGYVAKGKSFWLNC